MSKLIFYIIDENISFKWEDGGQNVFLKVIYMPRNSTQTKLREFSFKMNETSHEEFEVKIVSLSYIITNFV
jgi:hypothetical protein